MVSLTYTLQEGLIYGAGITGYLLVMMMTVNPRIWGYSDYPERVKRKVHPPSDCEKKRALLVAAPFFIFMSLYPIYSVFKFNATRGGNIEFLDAFTHLIVMAAFPFFGDLVLLDWVIISKITPSFVIIEGSDAEDYKDFSHHYVGHAYASVIILVICALVAFMVSIL
ncbi:hypothetical protein ACFL0D_01420 [Thermoproteota archaeon]